MRKKHHSYDAYYCLTSEVGDLGYVVGTHLKTQKNAGEALRVSNFREKPGKVERWLEPKR